MINYDIYVCVHCHVPTTKHDPKHAGHSKMFKGEIVDGVAYINPPYPFDGGSVALRNEFIAKLKKLGYEVAP